MAWIQDMLTMQDRFVGNIAALILVSMLFAANYERIKGKRPEYRLFGQILLNIGTYSIAEMLSCMLDGTPGRCAEAALWILNSLLYFINMQLGLGWVRLIAVHLGYPIPKRTGTILWGLLLFGVFLLLVNPFRPLIFVLQDNVYYERGPLCFIYVLIAGIYFSYSVFMYVICRRNGGVLKYFPVWMYLVPSIIGIFLESVTGNSMVSVCNAIAICAVLAGMQQEDVFRDRLTGIFNRAYLEELKGKLERTRSPFVSGIMLDLNGFKSINDNFGHAEGDQALVIAAGLIREAVSSFGDVIRYAGDEFVVILNLRDRTDLEACGEKIRESFDAFNRKNEKPYRLTVSMGFANFNAESQTVNEFLNAIDKNMYENKREYYKEHGTDRRKRG